MDTAQLIERLQLTRRNFLKLGVIAGASATLPSCVQTRLPGLLRTEVGPLPPRGPESWVSSVCTLCPAGCGLQVRVIEGKAVGIQGHPSHPVNKGTLCPRGVAGLQALYHPDRLHRPVRRVGKRSENRWEAIDWDDALQLLTRRLQGLRGRGEPHRLGLLMGPATPLAGLLFERFAQAFGTPNLFRLEWPMGQGPRDAFAFMHGTPEWAYDLEHTDFVLGFGLDWLQAFPSPVEASRAYGVLRRGRSDRRIRVVQAESRLSVTGLKADEWVPIKPGTEGALALGLAHVLIAEERYDQTFVAQHTVGFDDWTDVSGPHTGFKTLVLDEYPPASVSDITGVPVETIVRLAREFASHTPALALVDRVRTYDQMAVHSLNALAGSLGVRGGVVPLQPPPISLPPLSDETGQRKGAVARLDGAGGAAFPFAQDAPHHLTDVVLSGMPYTLDTLLLSHANPLFTSPEPARWAQTLERLPFVVTITAFLDESALFADLILPEHVPLEGWQDGPTSTLSGTPVFGIGQPVVKPLYDTRHVGDIVLELARGLDLTEALPWQDFQEALQEGIKGVFGSGQGEPLGPRADEEDSSFEGFWKDVSTTGGWTDRSHEANPASLQFKTRSGKFEFAVPRLREQSGSDIKALPHYEPPSFAGEHEKFPLHLCVYTPLAFAGGEGAHLPFLQSTAGPYTRERWETWVEINPETGERLGLADEDLVWVESPVGRMKAKVRWYSGALPDVVNLPFGLGHTAMGRWAQGVGANPGDIVARRLDPVTGQPFWQMTRVRIEKVEGGNA